MITTINHIGIGVRNIKKMKELFRKELGFKLALNDNQYNVWELEPIFNRKPKMRIVNCMNPYSGPTIEFFQHIDTTPAERTAAPEWSDVGILELGIEVGDIEGFCNRLTANGAMMLSSIYDLYTTGGERWKCTYYRNKEGILMQLVDKHRWRGKAKALGISHVGIGVGDLKQQLFFYKEMLGFDRVIAEEKDLDVTLSDVMTVDGRISTVWLGRSRCASVMSSFDGGVVKLICSESKKHRRVFENRRFGDVGISEIGMEVDCMRSSFGGLKEGGVKVLVEPTEFDLGLGPRGTLAYIEDPEGNVIELVELKSLFKLPPIVLDRLFIRPMNLLSKAGLI
ncbi:MAG: VOC family protein [Clostridia bacterium]|nr:VOC family protein [Clostridia bacterium]